MFAQRAATALPAVARLPRTQLYELFRLTEMVTRERPPPDALWTLYQIAAFLGVDYAQARRLMAKPDAPRPFDPEERLWRAGDLYRWLDHRTQPARPPLRLIPTPDRDAAAP